MTVPALCLLLAAVAPGFPDWTGLDDTNLITVDPACPFYVSPSDLRHKASVVLQVQNDATFPDQLRAASAFLACMPPEPKIDAWENTWAKLDHFPRQSFLLVSVVGKKPSGKFRETVTELASGSADYTKCPFYMNVAPVGDKPSKRIYPYVFIYGPKGEEPVWQGTVTQTNTQAALEAFRKVRAIKQEWTPKTGVAEIRAFPSVPKLIDAGKFDSAKAVLKAGFKNADPEIAAEAQIVYDAIEQYRGDLLRKIPLECKQEPETAFADIVRLTREFPSEKKKVQKFAARVKNDKIVQLMGNAIVALSAYEAAKEKGDMKASDMKKLQQEIVKNFKQMKQHEKDGLPAQREASFMRLLPRVESAVESIKSETRKK